MDKPMASSPGAVCPTFINSGEARETVSATDVTRPCKRLARLREHVLLFRTGGV